MYEFLYEGKYLPDLHKNYARLNELDQKIELSLEEQQEFRDIRFMQIKQAAIYPRTDEILNYLVNNLKINLILVNKDPNYYVHIIWPIRRFLLLFTCFFCIYYFYWYKNIEVIIGTISLSPNLLTLIYFVLLCYIYKLWYITGYIDTTEGFNVSHKKYGKRYNHNLFLFGTVFICIITFFIFFKDKFILMSCEIIFTTSIITIVDHYSTTEKIMFLFHYLDCFMFQQKFTMEEQAFILHYLRQIDFTQLINTNVSLQLIKDYIVNIIDQIYLLESNHRKLRKEILLDLIGESTMNQSSILMFFRNSIGLLATMTTGVKIYQLLKFTYYIRYNHYKVYLFVQQVFRAMRYILRKSF